MTRHLLRRVLCRLGRHDCREWFPVRFDERRWVSPCVRLGCDYYREQTIPASANYAKERTQ